MRKVKEPKIIYHYVGDDSPEAKAESERILEEVFDKIFTMALKNLREKKGTNTLKSK